MPVTSNPATPLGEEPTTKKEQPPTHLAPTTVRSPVPRTTGPTARATDLAAEADALVRVIRDRLPGRLRVQLSTATLRTRAQALASVGWDRDDRRRNPYSARERFEIVVGSSFPYVHPNVWVTHRRWAGTPHVQWGRFLCLYAAPSVEWNPADGMRGLIARLNLWLRHAAAGELDPAGEPLHPPVVYSSDVNGWVVVHPDLDHLVPWSESSSERVRLLYAWCTRTEERVDILEWLTAQQVYDRFVAGEMPARDQMGRTQFAAPLVLISDTLDMEYPSRANVLATALEAYGYPRDDLLRALVNARTINKVIGAALDGDNVVPAMMLLGTPARRPEPGRPLAHVTAWRLHDLGTEITNLLEDISPDSIDLAARTRKLAEDWLRIAKVQWMVIYEKCQEVTRRRDSGSPARWLSGKRVLVFGCGALGAPIAEQCVRADVRRLHIVDKGTVTPGILVRQPYDDGDIGYNKAQRLAERLSRIRRDLTVTFSTADIVTNLLATAEEMLDYDLIIDATADVGVRVGIEKVRASTRDRWPTTIGALFGHTCSAWDCDHCIERRDRCCARCPTASSQSTLSTTLPPGGQRSRMTSFLTRPAPTASSPSLVVRLQPSLVPQEKSPL